MIRKAEEDEKNRIRNMEYNAEMQYKDKNGEGKQSEDMFCLKKLLKKVPLKPC